MDGAFPSDRGQSFDSFAGDSQYGRQRRGFRGTAENAKTKLCMRWLAGECRFGPRCNFAHGDHELRKLPPKNPGRFSQDARDRDSREKDRGRGRGGYGYGSVSFDAGYNRPLSARPAPQSIYDSYYPSRAYGDSYTNGAPPYNRVYGPGQGPGPAPGPGPGPGPAPTATNGAFAPMPGRGAAPVHVTAHGTTTAPRDFYAPHGYPIPGPNGWTMYRDPDSGEPYYHNHHSNVTQWNRPPEWPVN